MAIKMHSKTATEKNMRLGIDLGSSTAKIVVLSENNIMQYKRYQRHNGRIKEMVQEMLGKLHDLYPSTKFHVQMTGSAGMGLARRIDVPFVQEVVALTEAIRTLHPDAATFIELGGEDAKIVLFHPNQAPEMKMNGSCAGGTGSFIDQMATLLHVDMPTLNEMAHNATKKLYIASRCGVFAKTDVQALLNKGESKEDIARAVFLAVANQTMTTLLAGAEIRQKILFAGGPLTFLPELRRAFIQTLQRPESDFVLPDNSEVLVAVGAAIKAGRDGREMTITQLLNALQNEKKGLQTIRTLEPLFKSKQEHIKFKHRHNELNIPRLADAEIKNVREMYLGIDAGSTTTKLILIDEKNRIIDQYYSNNFGSPLQVALKGLQKFKRHLTNGRLKAAFATGYGEEFICVALNLDGGIVETMAHFTAGSLFNKELSYIVDVGGQDIKSIKVENGVVTDIKLNEACSSGTGSFIQTFADSLNLTLDEFVQQALYAEHPVDLGTRCSVFMNSKVKEALKDGISVSDIAAGLAFSVVKNALYKVIQIKSTDELGNAIFVQGGTFKNDAVLRAFELLTGKQVFRLNISEYMGSFGAALYAKYYFKQHPGVKTRFKIDVMERTDVTKKTFACKGCGNHCSVTRFTFSNNNKFYTGNRCERFFSNKSSGQRIEMNFFRDKEDIIFNAEQHYLDASALPENDAKMPVIGIPRILSVYEHYPFFYSFFRKLGFKVVLSDNTNKEMYYRGLRSVAADNLCLPAKVANGHIFDLMDKKVDRIFIPSIVFERKEADDSKNSYNCPIVTGYGEVLKRTIKTDIPIDSFPMSFQFMAGFKANIAGYLQEYGVSKREISRAVDFSLAAEQKSVDLQRKLAAQIIAKARAEDKPLIIILGRPYHLDPMVNNGIMDMVSDLGAYAISENAIPDLYNENLDGVLPLTQWSYHNRLYLAAKWIVKQNYDQIAGIQLNSFGCGPDAVVTDEVKTILESGGKIYASIKIDEMSNLGAAKIRIRSVLEALNQNKHFALKKRRYSKHYSKNDRKKTIIVPYLARGYSELLEPVVWHLGYKIETLHEQSAEAVEEGLRFVNNDMCYPAVVVIGDLLKALRSGKYDPDETVVALTLTNGQCRASNYVPLLKKALVDAGFLNTPVVSLSSDSFAEGFVFNPIKFLKYSVIVFAAFDAIMRMKLRTKPYELNTGETMRLVDRLTKEFREQLYREPPDKRSLVQFMHRAVNAFNAIPVRHVEYARRIGVVGEIYVKSNCFSNNYLVDWLEERGYEAVLPSYLKFFEYGFYSQVYNLKNKISFAPGKIATRTITHLTIHHYRKIVEKELVRFVRYIPETPIDEALREKDNPLPLSLQFGEGWLLPLEIVEMVKEGVKDVISVQPFGCISNHIVAKGIYRQLKDEYGVNMLLLDYESGTSEVNNSNRLELFLSKN